MGVTDRVGRAIQIIPSLPIIGTRGHTLLRFFRTQYSLKMLKWVLEKQSQLALFVVHMFYDPLTLHLCDMKTNQISSLGEHCLG